MKGWNPFSAAENLGISQLYIRNLLSLAEAPKEVKETTPAKKDF